MILSAVAFGESDGVEEGSEVEDEDEDEVEVDDAEDSLTATLEEGSGGAD